LELHWWCLPSEASGNGKIHNIQDGQSLGPYGNSKNRIGLFEANKALSSIWPKSRLPMNRESISKLWMDRRTIVPQREWNGIMGLSINTGHVKKSSAMTDVDNWRCPVQN
jgi:hypothetical protein